MEKVGTTVVYSVVVEEKGRTIWGGHECGLMGQKGVKIWLCAFSGD